MRGESPHVQATSDPYSWRAVPRPPTGSAPNLQLFTEACDRLGDPAAAGMQAECGAPREHGHDPERKMLLELRRAAQASIALEIGDALRVAHRPAVPGARHVL